MKKTNQIIIPISFMLLLAIFLTGCSGSIKRTESVGGHVNVIENTKLSGIDVSMSEAIKDKLDGNITFDISILEKNIKSQLKSANLKDDNSKYNIVIVVNDVRVRSTFNAVMWGFMAGDDHIQGKATIRDTDGNVVNEYDVNASYSLGGLGGGQDSSRMGWLYEKFAELVVEGINGNKKEG